jgi:hypothetical protein
MLFICYVINRTWPATLLRKIFFQDRIEIPIDLVIGAAVTIPTHSTKSALSQWRQIAIELNGRIFLDIRLPLAN